MKSVIAIATFALAIACSPGATQRPAAGAADEDAPAFDRGEQEVLHDLLAIDRRLARRANMKPSEEDLRRVALAAVLKEDPTLAVIDGAIDPFSFDARQRGLEAARTKVNGLRPGPSRKVEHELLRRYVEAEIARLDDERKLPRSASALIRGIVETWEAPKDIRDAEEKDRWLERRLTAIEPNGLDIVRARELDDTLDTLERLTTGFVKATKALVTLREKLEAVDRKPLGKGTEWTAVENRLKTHLGIHASADELARAFEVLETELRPKADAVVTVTKNKDGLDHAVELELGIGAKPCALTEAPSPLRVMAAPPEREVACRVREAMGKPYEPAVLYTYVVVAEWALDVARGARTLSEAQGKHHLLPDIQADTRAHLERLAVVSPVAAIAAGEAVRVLVTDPSERAKEWAARGDVPFDVLRRELP